MTNDEQNGHSRPLFYEVMMIALRMIQYFTLLPLHLLMGLVCWLLSPMLPLSAIGREALPAWLSWFQTPDAPLDGDSGFNDQNQHPVIVKLPRYIRRMLWLIRNPAYGFAWTVLAYKPESPAYKWSGSFADGVNDGHGWFFMRQPSGHFQFSMRYQWIFGRYFYLRFGWKIIGLASQKGDNWLERKKFVFTLNPVDGG